MNDLAEKVKEQAAVINAHSKVIKQLADLVSSLNNQMQQLNLMVCGNKYKQSNQDFGNIFNDLLNSGKMPK